MLGLVPPHAVSVSAAAIAAAIFSLDPSLAKRPHASGPLPQELRGKRRPLTARPDAVEVSRPRRGGWSAGISSDTIYGVAMTLRLTDNETDALRRRAQREGRSMQDVARTAVRDYIERTSQRELLDEVLDAELPRYAEALRRLGE
jgi:hypothetical protein